MVVVNDVMLEVCYFNNHAPIVSFFTLPYSTRKLDV